MKTYLATSILRLRPIFLAALVVLGISGATLAQQASLTLTNADAKYCYTHNNTWTLTKEVTGNTIENGVGTVTWTITAAKDSSGNPTFTVYGGLTITNSGSAPATIGNIVINLQKPAAKNPQKTPWVSIAADVADATNGDAATSAMIVARASQENAVTNAAQGPPNYTVSGAKGTFTETAGSGALNFTDAMNNTVFSLVPQPVIPAGQSITLLYSAGFSPSILPAAGTPLRVEALVSFGNAGGRGGSGASATNIDINGNGMIDSDEANVRTVVSRVTTAPLPIAPEECNDSVTVTDPGVTTSGTVTTSNPVGFDQFPATVNATTNWMVSVDVNSGVNGGQVCNQADLAGMACGGTLTVIVGYLDPPLNTMPIYATYECAPAAEASDSACVEVSPPGGGGGCPPGAFCNGQYCTYSQGGYGGPGAPFQLLNNNFAAVFPSGVEVGTPGAGGNSMRFTSAAAVQAYLPAGGPSGALTGDLVNPVSSSSGVFGGQVLTLKINVAFSDFGATPNSTGNFGDLYYCNPGDSLHGMTVRQILAALETALGGGGLPSGHTFDSLNTLANNLNINAFHECEVGPFAAFLSRTPCP
jgi:hypothetical protein